MTLPKIDPETADPGAGILYWPFYCEENIWHLCDHEEVRGRSPHVLLISNDNKSVAFWNQRLAPGPGLPVVWDYHVVLLCRWKAGWEIWDLDSGLPCPCPAAVYLRRTFPALVAPDPAIEPLFRRVNAARYRKSLASDRRHMRDASGEYLQPPPPWDPIGEGSNLMCFLAMGEAFHGEVLDLHSLERSLREA